MDRKKKIVVTIGVFLVLLSGFFPPFEGEFVKEGDNLRKHLGHHFLFSPPTPDFVFEAFRGSPPPATIGQYLLHYRAKLIFSEVVLQLLVIVIATVGVALLFAKRKESTRGAGGFEVTPRRG
ncbi:MAG: hypothetical protein MRJ65_17580 [Candidatus Brocadiaceae bacterium]|nr:hypothetical protein [Candidatus Brocadiaceae bacterium]